MKIALNLENKRNIRSIYEYLTGKSYLPYTVFLAYKGGRQSFFEKNLNDIFFLFLKSF